jgi:molybdopterin-guanine dinucleotide biosynthesis protein A
MGQPKAMLRIRAQPILTYLLNRFAWKGPRWLITAPGAEHPPGWEGFDRELIDPEPDLGPLRGILTALESLQTQYLVVATVDMPSIEIRQFHALLAALESTPAIHGVMFSRVTEGRQSIEPFPMALRMGATIAVRDRLSLGQRSVHRLLDDPGFLAIPAAADWDVWTNLNRPADLEEFLTKTGR